MTPSGDMQFGAGSLNFYRNVPDAVGQRAGTRLKLWQGEFWLNLLAGTPWFQQILQQNNYGLASAVIRDRILGTPYAVSLENFSATFNSTTRQFSTSGQLNTAFGTFYFNYPAFGNTSSTIGGLG